MKKRELFVLLITIFALYFVYQFIITFFILPQPLTSKDLRNNSVVSSQKLYDETWKMVKKYYISTDYNSQDWKRWKNHYKGKIKTDEDARVAIDTMLASLNDPYSRFLPKKEYEEQYTSIDSHISGIGINIVNRSGESVVYSIIENTPAQKANLQPNDIIVSVNNKNVKGMDLSDVANLVRGPLGSTVTLKIKRHDKYIVKKLVRAQIEIKSIDSKVLPNNIGYIKIKSFIGSNTASEFVKALKNVDKTRGIIVDLRGNTGGLLTNAVIVANLFINNGTIVSIVSRNGEKQDITAQMNIPIVTKPTVVLVDEVSASASEILSGALKDNHKAVLVGTRTFGKGLVQQIIPLPNGTGLNITIAKYLTPNGSDINNKGIEPDIQVPYSLVDMKKHNDTQLRKGISIVNNMCK